MSGNQQQQQQQGVLSSWTKGDRKARRELERALESDKDDHLTRFALSRLLANKGEWVAAEDLLRGPGVEAKLLADPTTHVARLSSLGEAYLVLWRARGQYSQRIVENGQGDGTKYSCAPESRLDVSGERRELLHKAQGFLEEALAAPENVNDPVLQAQVAFCKEARGDCSGALSIYAGIIADSPLSPGTSAVIFRTSVLLAHVGRFDECVRYLEFIEGDPPKGCSHFLLEALLYMCNMAMGLELKVSKRVPALREAYHAEFDAGRMGTGVDREKVPWDRLPGWVCMWQELGEQSMRRGDYYLSVLMSSQALLIKENAETLVSTGEMLWVLGDAKRALQHCERAYAADASHAGAKRRLAGWAPDKWKERIAKEENRRSAVAEMQRLAARSDRKADAMVARRRRRDKARIFKMWRRLHYKMKNMASRRASAAAEEEEEAATAQHAQKRQNDGATNSSLSSSASGSRSSYSSSGSGSSSVSSSSSSGLSVSTLSSESAAPARDNTTGQLSGGPRWSPPAAAPPGGAIVAAAPGLAKPQREEAFRFPTPSAEQAERAGRANFRDCFRAERAKLPGAGEGVRRGGAGAGEVGVDVKENNMASVEVAAKVVREVMVGGGGQSRASRRGGAGCRGYHTPEMRALAQFEWRRREHDAKNTRAIFGS